MKIRKLLRILHRDFGYFIVGMTVVYCLSGIYLNHRHDFNPDYKIFITEFQAGHSIDKNADKNEIISILENLEREVVYKKHYLNSQDQIKIFIENGEIVIDPQSGNGTMHYLQKRPVIFEMNKFHRATIGTLWKWTSDAMAAILIIVAVSGLFILKGKRSFSRWGWWLTIIGIIIPLFFVIVYM